ncbi:MAG TPA: hypothetical protein VKU00_25845 [Chthonomonadaceae bacterium]|nr:hypothetical protein [Chthonomonadaceae bacterium]
MNPPGPPIMGANILDSGGNVIGTIASYDWPIAGGTVIPSVTANPTPAINLSAVFALPPGPPAQIPIPPGGAVPVQVTNMNGVVVIGTLQGFTTVPYLDFIHQIDVYQAQFDPPLFGEDHGLPVVLANDPSVLVGMVIVTQSNNGAINTFIARI